MSRGKVFSILLTAAFLLSTIAHPSFAYTLKEKTRGGWKTHKDDHVIIYYYPNIAEKYAKRFAKESEYYYDAITERLGFKRFVFWLFDNRAKIYVHETRKDYLEETGRPAWSAAVVNIRKKSIRTFFGQENFFDEILPHEFTHIILRELIGLKRKLPLWFEEGVACANEKDSHLKYFLLAKKYREKGLFMPIQNIGKIKKSRHIAFPTLFYATSASVILFLLDKYRSRSFLDFCKRLSDGDDFYEAMDRVYDIKDAKDLNDKFFAFLHDKSLQDITDINGFNGK